MFKAYVDDGVLPEGYGADIGAAIHYIDGEIEAFITEKDGAQVYWCEQAERGARLEPQQMTKI